MRKYFLLLLALCNTAQAVQYLPSDIVAKGKLNPSTTGQDMNTTSTRWDFWVATLNTNLGAGVTYIDGSGNLAVDTTVSATELSYLNGVTSAIQGQIDGKQATGNYITALTSDVTATGPGSAAATIANDAVTNAKAANMAQSTIKGRAVSAGTGDPTDLTATQATAILDVMVGDSGAGGTKGLVPAPGIGDAALCLKGSGAYGSCGGSASVTVSTKTAAYTVVNADDVILCSPTAGTPLSITMHAASTATSKPFKFKNIGSDNCTILPNGSDTFDGDTSIILPSGGVPSVAVEIISNGGSLWSIF